MDRKIASLLASAAGTTRVARTLLRQPPAYSKESYDAVNLAVLQLENALFKVMLQDGAFICKSEKAETHETRD